MSQVETWTQYLVELETGIGYSNKGGYAVFTGHRWCKTKREAQAVANKLCQDKPLFQVRIMREFRRRGIVMTFVPLRASNQRVQPAATEPAEQAGRGPLGCDGLLGADHLPEIKQ